MPTLVPPRCRPLRAGWALLAMMLVGCPAARQGPPQHYEDPEAMIDRLRGPGAGRLAAPRRGRGSAPDPDQERGDRRHRRRLGLLHPAAGAAGSRGPRLRGRRRRRVRGLPAREPRVLGHARTSSLTSRSTTTRCCRRGSIDLVFSANTYAYIRNRVAYFQRVRGTLTGRGRLALIDFRPDATPAQRYRAGSRVPDLRGASEERARRSRIRGRVRADVPRAPMVLGAQTLRHRASRPMSPIPRPIEPHLGIPSPRRGRSRLRIRAATSPVGPSRTTERSPAKSSGTRCWSAST